MLSVEDLIKVLQGSIAPVVLISGVALLILSLTNRLGRATDRIRALCHEIKKNTTDDVADTEKQIEFLFIRCQILRMSISMSIITIVCVAVIILTLFSIHIFHVDLIGMVEFMFSLGLLTFIVSAFLFLRDIYMSLHSLKIEIDRTIAKRS